MKRVSVFGILCVLMMLMVVQCVDNPPAATITDNMDTDWRDEIIYQLLVDRFGDGDSNNNWRVLPGVLGRYQGGDWQGILDRLDYLEELGVTAIWISPVVLNVDNDVGFDGYYGY